jgi:hypothetical protein
MREHFGNPAGPQLIEHLFARGVCVVGHQDDERHDRLPGGVVTGVPAATVQDPDRAARLSNWSIVQRVSRIRSLLICHAW